MKSIEEKRKKFLENLPIIRRRFFEMAFKGSRANAIKAKCLDCTCLQMDQITNCTIQTCALWEVRPYQPKRSVAKRAETDATKKRRANLGQGLIEYRRMKKEQGGALG